MSRIGKKPITIPTGTEVIVSDDFITVKGKGGELKQSTHKDVKVVVDGSEVRVEPVKENTPMWGTMASLIKNMIIGVNDGFQKQLVVEGIGFKVNLQGKKLVLEVGFSHPVELDVPDDLQVEVEKNTITIKGINKENVGQFAAVVRAVKKPEPYKGKGIRYVDEIIRRKEGKRVAG